MRITMNFFYSFPAVKGIQAKQEYYIAMVPLKMVKKLFPDEDEFVLPEYRAQRRININRIPEIKNYILSNRDSYVFSALAASIDGDFEFVQDSDTKDVGKLKISMDAKFLINDGQHRKAALLEAMNEDESLGEETISIVFFMDNGLKRSQQMFTDLNKHAVKTSNSISELYDSRDQLAVLTRTVISEIDFLDQYVDKEKDMLGKYSSSLFTLNNFYNANKRIIGRIGITENTYAFLNKFWETVTNNMVPWIDLENKNITKLELRERYIACQAVIIQALGRVGNYYYENNNVDLKGVAFLKNIDWLRSNKIWRDRVIKENGRMITNENAIILASNIIKKELHIPLSLDEKNREAQLKEK